MVLVTQRIGALQKLLALKSLPPLPAVAVRLMILLRRDDVSFREVAEVLETDAAFTAEVLRLANSPAFGRYKVSSVLQAISMLGLLRLRSIVTTLGMSRYLAAVSRTPALRRLWEHNLATAVIAERISEDFGQDPDLAYVAGLLHDIGRIGLLICEPDTYLRSLEDTSETLGRLELERLEVGVDHAEAGATIARAWGLPDELIAVIADHHNPRHERRRTLTGVVRAASIIAGMIGFPASGKPRPWDGTALQALLPENVPIPADPGEFAYAIAERINRIELEYDAVVA